MKKTKKIILLVIFLFISIIVYLKFKEPYIKEYKEYIKIQKYGNPIAEDGTINNSYFDINADGAKDTTSEINNAIKYANKNNIEYLKLEKGTYLINGVGKYFEKKGIILMDNINLDLNGSIIKHESVSDIRYSIITIFETANVTIQNGILIGDSQIHDYSKYPNSTHEYGYGIELRGAKNVILSNLQISQLTGDGILISEMEAIFSEENKNVKNISENIEIKNCDIFQNRRQGISIIDAQNVKIHDAEIHDINGTNPQAAIDLEPNLKSEFVDNISIYNNKIYNLGCNNAIIINGGTKNVNIYDNDMFGGIEVASTEGTVNIKKNKIKKGKLKISLSNYNYDRGYNLNTVIVDENEFENVNVDINKATRAILKNNKLSNYNKIIVSSSNLYMYNNYFYTNGELNYKLNENDKENYIVALKHILDNSINLKENIQTSENIQVIRDEISVKSLVE